MAKSVFNFESEDRVESPERLNEYVKIATPGVWVTVIAVVIVAVAFVVWGFIGKIPKTITLKGGVDTENYHIFALVDPYLYDAKELVGKEVSFTLPSRISGTGKVVNATPVPFSRAEIADILKSDFLTNALVTSDYSNVLDVESGVDLSRNELEIGDVTILVDEVSPISFFFN